MHCVSATAVPGRWEEVPDFLQLFRSYVRNRRGVGYDAHGVREPPHARQFDDAILHCPRLLWLCAGLVWDGREHVVVQTLIVAVEEQCHAVSLGELVVTNGDAQDPAERQGSQLQQPVELCRPLSRVVDERA